MCARWQESGAEWAAKLHVAGPLTHKESSRRRAQAMVDGLNRHVMARHEADLAALPPEVRASRTSEEWLATPPLEILRLAREAKATPSPVAPVPGGRKSVVEGESVSVRVDFGGPRIL